jgi:predicted RND superfamily exporter protein
VLVDAILRWARRWRLSILAGSALLSIAGLIAVRSIAFDSDVLHLLPRHGRVVPGFQEFLQKFGSLDYLYVVFDAPADRTVDEYEDEIAAFVDKLKTLPEIERVDAGLFDASRDWAYLGDRELLVLSPARLQDALGRFDAARMPAELQAQRELLSVPSPEIAQMVRQDPLGLFSLLRDQMSGAAAAFSIDPTRRGYVTKDGRSRLLLVKPARPPFDSEFTKQLFARLDVFTKELESTKNKVVDDETLPPLNVTFAGAHRISLETEREVRGETVWNSVGSLAVILPLLYLAFRSWWLVAVGAVPSAIAMLLVLAAYAASGIALSAAAAGAAAMQFGLGVDGVVLLFVAFRQRVSDRLSADEAALALGEPSASMLLGMFTTAATFYGLAVIDFPSLQELGLLIGHSMVLCGIFTLVLVPAFFPRRVKKITPPLTAWWLSRLVFRHARALVWGAVAVTIALGIAALWLRVDPSLDKLRSSSNAAEVELQVAQRFGLPRDVYLLLARGPDLESLLVDNERVVDEIQKTLPKVAVHAPASLLPSQARQNEAAARIKGAGLTPDALPKIRETLATAAKATGFRDDTFAPFLDRLPRLLDPNARLTYDGFQSKGLQDLLGRTIARDGNDYVLATYAYPTTDAEIDMLRAIAARHADRMTLTGMPEVNRELKARFTPEFLKGLTAGTVLVLALIVYSFRRIDLTLLAMVPTVLALIWGAGVLALARVDLDMFSVFAVMTFVGIGVDYGIHMVHRFHHTPPAQADTVIAQLGPVILVAGAITLLGFGTLVTSSYGPLRSLGVVSSVLVVTLMFSTLLVLPALLLRRLKKTPLTDTKTPSSPELTPVRTKPKAGA